MIFYIVLSLSFFINPSLADMTQAKVNAKAFADTMNQYVPTDVGDVPGFVGTNVPESKLNKNTIETSKFERAAKDETYQMIKDSIEQRPPYEIDIVNDPMIKASNDVLAGDKDVQSEEEHNEPTMHTCTRGRTVYESKCHIELVPALSGIRKEIRKKQISLSSTALNGLGTHLSFALLQTSPCQCLYSANHAAKTDKATIDKVITSLGISESEIKKESVRSVKIISHDNLCWKGEGIFGNIPSWFASPTYYICEITYEAEIPTYELVQNSNCDALENLVDKDKCTLVSRVCTDSQKTKIIDGQELSAECWKEELTYKCFSEEHNTCQSLLKNGCTQVSSTCKTKDGDECIEWEQTFECHERQSLAKYKLKWDDTPCLNGDCVEQSWEPNRDMADSLSKLSIFKEMQKDMDPNTQTVFKGENRQCSRVVAGVKNCCIQKGWGMKVGLANCSADEKLLAEQRQQNKCIQIGTYCAEKTLGKCIRKKTSFCCYNSKLARIINEQGARQLQLSFGEPEHPNCKVITLSNLTNIDFCKIDFSEVFQDIANQTKIPNVSSLTKGIQQSMADKSRLITDKQNRITQGRSNDNF